MYQPPARPSAARRSFGRSRRALVGLLALIAAGPLAAHHSFAMFDGKQSVTLHGTVKEFQWTNPHCFIQILVPDQGALTEWSIEMSSPADIYRQGWRPGTLKPGDKVTLVIHPTRDGVKGGSFISGVGPNGEVLLNEKPHPAGKPPT